MADAPSAPTLASADSVSEKYLSICAVLVKDCIILAGGPTVRFGHGVGYSFARFANFTP